MQVAEAAVAALGDDDALALLGEVGEQGARVLVEHLRADRDLEHGVRAAPAGAVAAHAVHAGLGLEMLLVAEVDQRVEAGEHSTTTSPPRRRRRRRARRTR